MSQDLIQDNSDSRICCDNAQNNHVGIVKIETSLVSGLVYTCKDHHSEWSEYGEVLSQN